MLGIPIQFNRIKDNQRSRNERGRMESGITVEFEFALFIAMENGNKYLATVADIIKNMTIFAKCFRMNVARAWPGLCPDGGNMIF